MKTRIFPTILATASMLVAGMGMALAQNQQPAVAQISLVVGQASLVRANGETQPLQRGLSLHESDRLITGDDGMVMLIFVDQGRVALRPGSELLIRKYRYDTAGADSDLQLELLKGTVRQISGKAAKQQPERYRLNTPVAAIGVRGTDFLARAEVDAVRTYVHEGAITVQSRLVPQAPVLNKAGEGSYLMAYGEGRLEQHSLKLAELEQSFSIQLTPQASTTVAVAKQSSRSANTSARDDDGVAVIVASSSSVLAARAQTTQSGEWLNQLAVSRPDLPNPDQPGSVQPEKLPTALVWGRFYENPNALPLTLPQAYASAKQERSVTVGEPFAYALWREGAAGSVMDKGLSGSANFSLAAGEGYYTSSTGAVQAAQLSDARLQVDFDRSQFQTSMNLAASGQPNQHLQVGGSLSSDGILLGKTTSQRVSGALSLDGTQAGYLFQADTAGGAYKGITLWNKK